MKFCLNMLQQTKSLYARRQKNILTSLGDDNDVNQFTEKLYTRAEVDNLRLNDKNIVSSIAKEINNESLIADKQIRQDNRTVADLVRKSNRIILSISSHAFPFDIFPDSLNVEEGRITLITRHFLSSEVHSIDIKDISNIFINTTFLFSQLVFVSKTFEENEVRMRNLRTNEAVYARRIIEGLRIFENKQIDTCIYTKAALISKLEQLSTIDIVT
jgi:hypothetical protein